MVYFSYTEENYIKAVYKLSERDKGKVSTNKLADELGTTPASVTDMLKKLAQKKLIKYEKYQGVSLTSSGNRLALKVIRKHRLWEVFLFDKLQFGWEDVHLIAEQLEHIQSDILTDKLDEFLGFPKSDPHGDPIPDKEGRFSEEVLIQLAKAEPGTSYILSGVSDHTSEFLKMLDKIGLLIGKEFLVVDKLEYDGSLEISLEDNNEKPLFLSQKTVSNLWVKTKNS